MNVNFRMKQVEQHPQMNFQESGTFDGHSDKDELIKDPIEDYKEISKRNGDNKKRQKPPGRVSDKH